ncbi:unnamed protein product [Blepharisma stoltei]|uniref:Spindle assembly checkpoint component MAD1 n=1 Tax=Blepharisma stoltei TaxID=1481888 RepID=A0AAU9J9Y9_9CILI|nr:unnamed protein product [Blepharisma stoltei]
MEDKNKDINVLKQNLITLKNALKDEREERASINSQLQVLNAEINKVEFLIEQRSLLLENLRLENHSTKNDSDANFNNESTPSEILDQTKENPTTGPSYLESSNLKLEEDIRILKQENKNLAKKVEEIKEYKEKNHFTSREARLRFLAEELRKEITETRASISKSKADYKNLNDDNLQLIESNDILGKHMIVEQKKFWKSEEILTNLKKQIEAMDEYQNVLEESVKKHEEKELEMAEMLVEIKSKIVTAESYYQQFDVEIVSSLFSKEAKLVIRKSNDGATAIEINQGKNKKVYDIDEIDTITHHEFKENRFIMQFTAETVEFECYDSEEVDKIISIIREVMVRTLKC